MLHYIIHKKKPKLHMNREKHVTHFVYAKKQTWCKTFFFYLFVVFSDAQCSLSNKKKKKRIRIAASIICNMYYVIFTIFTAYFYIRFVYSCWKMRFVWEIQIYSEKKFGLFENQWKCPIANWIDKKEFHQ